jgi:hypothetical protein
MSESAPKGAPEAATAKQQTRGDSNGHQGYMRGLGRRIRWLERHRHWWLRTQDGRAQREFLDRRDAA